MLTARLEAIVGYVNGTGVVADIGCDHGYAAQALIEQGRAQKVIACDISEASLDKARKLVESQGLQDCVETRVGNGFSILEKGEADTVIIAGMGGLLIRDMLQAQKEKAAAVEKLVLAPNRSEFELRKYLNENDFEITDEKLVKDNDKYYHVICARPGRVPTEEDEFYFHIGRKLVENKDPILKEYLGQKIQELERILVMAEKSTNAAQLVEQAAEKKRRMQEVEECL
ncbi:class I SAM-dependent methyltransferase [Christensenellaceae bacterium OttesenSCG-928-K19]|nr:class I SAM-dependent methyltransferase [Christensenellaceae bacterium OttesenSCG-928-K19]